jgi:hypothetical protein
MKKKIKRSSKRSTVIRGLQKQKRRLEQLTEELAVMAHELLGKALDEMKRNDEALDEMKRSEGSQRRGGFRIFGPALPPITSVPIGDDPNRFERAMGPFALLDAFTQPMRRDLVTVRRPASRRRRSQAASRSARQRRS